MALVLLAAALGSGCSGAKPKYVPMRRVVEAQTIVVPHPTPAPSTPRPVVPTRTQQAPRPDVVARSDSETPARGDGIARGIASYYDYPPCGSRGAAMLFYTWGQPYVRVVVTDAHTGRSVVATVCDNGPHVSGRVIDLSTSLFRELCPSCDGLISDVVVRKAA